MSTATQQRQPATDWEQEIRTLEEQGRVAFLAGDIATLDALMDDRLLVNSPLNIVNDKSKVLELLGKGLIRHPGRRGDRAHHPLRRCRGRDGARHGGRSTQQRPHPPPLYEHLAVTGWSLADDRSARPGDRSRGASAVN
jgi:hypothetical protein